MNHRQLNQLLLGRIEEVCQYLLPNGKRKGNEWKFGNIHDDPGDSAAVALSGAKIGQWLDRADPKVKGSTLVSLWCKVRHDDEYGPAADEIKAWLGVKDDDFEAPFKPKKLFRRPTSEEKKEAAPVDKRSNTLKYLEDERGLSVELLKQYKVCARSDDKGYIFCYYSGGESGPENLAMLKHVFIERDEKGKKRSYITKESEQFLFGKAAIPKNSDYLIITAGELDAISWAAYGHPAVSIPMGINNNNWVENDWDWLEQFATIYINYDSDEREQKAARDLAVRLGIDRCRNITLGRYKDANEMYCEGEPYPGSFIDSAKDLLPPDIEPFSDGVECLIDEMMIPEEEAPGFDNPWKDEILWKIRPKETSTVFGFTGHGKTSVMTQICSYLQGQGAKGMVASLEMHKNSLKADFVRCYLGEVRPNPEQIRYAVTESALSNIILVDPKEERMIKANKMLEYFRICLQRYGLDYIVLDNMMMCDVGHDDYDGQKHMIEALKKMARDFNTHFFIVAHVRKPPSKKEMAYPPDPYEIKGAGEIANLVDNSLSVWRNMDKHHKMKEVRKNATNYGDIEELKSEPDAVVKLCKQRAGVGKSKGWVGSAKLWCKAGVQFHTSPDANSLNYSLMELKC